MSVLGWARSLDFIRRLALWGVVLNAVYLVWLAFHISGPFGVVFYVLDTFLCGFIFLFVFNHWSRRYQLSGGSYSLRTPVDVFIPTVNEPLDILERTIGAATRINHIDTTIYILDDGHRLAVKKLAEKYQCHYLARPDSSSNRYKAANLNYALKHSYGRYILVIDADNIVHPDILDDLLGHFAESDVALVASRQAFAAPEGDFNHDHLFYNYMQVGKNAEGAAISCGSGVIYDRNCLAKIGGFSEWNLVEDFHTSYLLNGAGYRTVYVSQPYTTGHAPQDLSQIYKQRGTWATDTLRIFFWQQPLFNRNLSMRQRLHYFELGFCYLASAYVLPGIYLLNMYSLLFDTPIVTGGIWYAVFRLPALIATLWLFERLSQGNNGTQMWAGLFPAYQWASIKALLHPRSKPRYRVTSKVDLGGVEIHRVLPQTIFILATFVALIVHLRLYGLTLMLAFNCLWLAMMMYWLVPIIKRAIGLKQLRRGLWQRRSWLPKMSQTY